MYVHLLLYQLVRILHCVFICILSISQKAYGSTVQDQPSITTSRFKLHGCDTPLSLLSFQITSKLIRAMFTVALVCQTVTNKPISKGEEPSLTRDDISCIMIYAANGKSREKLSFN